MRLTNRHGAEIISLDDWETLGRPASSDHWKPGRSAYELARDWIEGDAATAVVSLLSVRPELEGIQIRVGIAEKRTQFDADSRGPRNHDLLLHAELPAGTSVTVGVEGKADEQFDLPLWRYRETALRRSPNTQALRRIDTLVQRWFGVALAADQDQPPLICLGYQLFSALAGTLADAKIHKSSRAVLLIMEYVTDLTDDAEHNYNSWMLDSFLRRLVGSGLERRQTPSGWITGFHPINGDGIWSANRTDVAFAKLVRDRRTRS